MTRTSRTKPSSGVEPWVEQAQGEVPERLFINYKSTRMKPNWRKFILPWQTSLTSQLNAFLLVFRFKSFSFHLPKKIFLSRT